MTLDKILADLDAARALPRPQSQVAYTAAWHVAYEFFQGSLSLPVAEALPIWQALEFIDEANELLRQMFQNAEQAKGEDR